MKKTTAGLFAAALIGTGLGAVQSAADAAPYPSSVRTDCSAHATGKPRAGKAVMIETGVQKVNDNVSGSPRGPITVTVEKLNGADSGSGSGFKPGDTLISLGKLKPGNYTGSMDFAPANGNSKFEPCSATVTFRVRPAR
ncbi:hypothetical protein FB382_000148 [Nocardioides ginsengisegetis]|uniref:Uncharacterized protein n=1 Tax=Nocardioides ginsengisegetis TaxID=661491 RepID=A0A7W3IWB4_9ACTN|nr:hypothetical protein [Nocardioides ginsengisegetis]MBA8801857.1 hypothetical protein [Nocardioides ginsengisegetis]